MSPSVGTDGDTSPTSNVIEAVEDLAIGERIRTDPTSDDKRGMRRRRVRPPRSGLKLIAAAAAACVLGLLAIVIWVSIRTDSTGLAPTSDVTLSRFPELVQDPSATRAILNTLGFATATVFVALVFGFTLALLVERTDMGGGRTIYALMTVNILIPGFFGAMGWVFIAHPRIGVLNQLASDYLGMEDPLFNVVSLYGMGWVQGLSLASVVFIFTAGSLRAMDSSLEEAAAMSGARPSTILRRVTFPLAWPGVLGAMIFTFTVAIATFDVPLLIGQSNRIIVFSTYLQRRTTPDEGLPEYGIAATFSVLMIVLGLALSWRYARTLKRSQRYQVVTGKNYQPRTFSLGRARWLARSFAGVYFLLAAGLPISLMIWTSLQPFVRLPDSESIAASSFDNYRELNVELFLRGMQNSIILMFAVPTVTIIVAIAISWVVLRTKTRGRYALDSVAFLTQAVPTVIFAFAAYQVVIRMKTPDLYGSVTILVIVMSITLIGFATRIVNGSLVQIADELEEAGRMSGASDRRIVWKITAPLIRPALLTTWIWVALLSFRELTIPTVLFAQDNATASVAVWSLWSNGEIGQASAVSVLMFAFLFPLVAAYWWWANRKPENRDDPTGGTPL